MGTSDPNLSGTASLTVIAADADEPGRRAVGQALAAATTELLAVVPTSFPTDDPTVTSMADRLSDSPRQALLACIRSGPPGLATQPGRSGGQQLTKRLAAITVRAAEDPGRAPIVVLRVNAVRAVGGFDPTFPGFGWVDLIERLRQDGSEVACLAGDVARLGEGQDLDDELPFIDALYIGLDGPDQIRSEGLWLLAHGAAERSVTAAHYRRAVVLAAGLARGSNERRRAKAAAADARRWWRGPAPHEAQVSIGRRADWRFLLAERHRNHVLILDGFDASDRWQWLVDDGWTERVSTSVEVPNGQTAPPDVIYIGRGASAEKGLAAAGTNCVVIIEHGRSPVERRQIVRAIDSAGGFGEIHRILVTPDLDRPKRFVPLGFDGGLEWLLGGPPPLPEHRNPLARSLIGRLRAEAVRIADKISASSTADVVGAGLGPGLFIATRGDEPVSDVLSVTGASVLVTSGHDEGSRVVLIPVASMSADDPASVAVTKIAPRPRYNANIDAEVSRVRTLKERIAASGDATIDSLLPSVDGPFDRGPLRVSTESYAGRWTASDLCYRTPETQDDVLKTVAEAIDHFSLATVRQRLIWSAEHFDEHLGSLFDRYAELVGRDESLHRLRALLLDRSEMLHGYPIPLVDRHFDLGPWNVVIGPEAALTIIDWELGPPRRLGQAGLAGSDQLYFIKYWLHIAMGLRSIDEELSGFVFLAPNANDPRAKAKRVLQLSLDRLGMPESFVPLLTAHVWVEAAIHTIERRKANGIEPGSPGRYLTAVARYGDRLLEFWPPDN